MTFVGDVSGALLRAAVAAVYRTADCRVLVFGRGHGLFSRVLLSR